MQRRPLLNCGGVCTSSPLPSPPRVSPEAHELKYFHTSDLSHCQLVSSHPPSITFSSSEREASTQPSPLLHCSTALPLVLLFCCSHFSTVLLVHCSRWSTGPLLHRSTVPTDQIVTLVIMGMWSSFQRHATPRLQHIQRVFELHEATGLAAFARMCVLFMKI